MSDMQNQAVLITGATGGIGQAVAETLAAQGAKLAVTGRDPQKLAALETRLVQAGAAAVVAGVVDVTVEEQVRDLVARAQAAFGRLDVLVNCPGLSVPGPIAAAKVEDFDRMFDVNVRGAFLCAKHFLAAVDEAAGGLVINVSSIASKRANPNAPLYCAAKAAATMLADGLALQVMAKNVRVTTVSPGAVDSQFWGSRPVPREKFLKPADVAEVIRFVINMPRRMVFHDIVFESFDFLRSK